MIKVKVEQSSTVMHKNRPRHNQVHALFKRYNTRKITQQGHQYLISIPQLKPAQLIRIVDQLRLSEPQMTFQLLLGEQKTHTQLIKSQSSLIPTTANKSMSEEELIKPKCKPAQGPAEQSTIYTLLKLSQKDFVVCTDRGNYIENQEGITCLQSQTLENSTAFCICNNTLVTGDRYGNMMFTPLLTDRKIVNPMHSFFDEEVRLIVKASQNRFMAVSERGEVKYFSMREDRNTSWIKVAAQATKMSDYVKQGDSLQSPRVVIGNGKALRVFDTEKNTFEVGHLPLPNTLVKTFQKNQVIIANNNNIYLTDLRCLSTEQPHPVAKFSMLESVQCMTPIGENQLVAGGCYGLEHLDFRKSSKFICDTPCKEVVVIDDIIVVATHSNTIEFI